MIPEQRLNIPWVHSPFFEEILAGKALDITKEKIARQYNQEGYIICPGLLSAEECDKIIEETDVLFDINKQDGSVSYYRYQDAWQKAASVKKLTSHSTVIDILNFLYDRRPFPFQTLNFKFGTQQDAHSDSIHFSCFPGRYMAGVWVALEDITQENGPLFYYPGSHNLPEFHLYDLGLGKDNLDYVHYEKFQNLLMEAKQIERKKLIIKKGDALIWSSNLVHGGSPILNKTKTRYSQVTHYYFENCIYYTPFYSNIITGELFVRRPTDISSGEVMENFYNNTPVGIHQVNNSNLFRITFDNAEFKGKAPLEPSMIPMMGNEKTNKTETEKKKKRSFFQKLFS